MSDGAISAVMACMGLVFAVVLMAMLNRDAERDCRDRGGQVIERPGQVNGCLRPAGDRR
jgi:hypothetical protein